MKVRVVEYKGLLVIVPNEPEKDQEKGWYPTNLDRVGSVVTDTKSRLGVSEAAFELMKQIEPNQDAIGDIDWWACTDGTYAFSWFGALHRVIDPEKSEGARTFHVTDALWMACTKIPNDVPPEAVQAIGAGGEELRYCMWKGPYRFETRTPPES